MVIKNQQGTTLIELLVAMAIIGIMSAIFVAQISLTDGEELNMVTERVAADLKQIRNLSTSRVINENNIYPPGGYGMYFDDTQDKGNSFYVLYADNGVNPNYQSDQDAIISKYIFPDNNIRVYPMLESEGQTFYFAFVNEHEVSTNVSPKEPDGYSINIIIDAAPNTVLISDPADDDYAWGNINILYGG